MNRDEVGEFREGSCTLCGKRENSLTYTGSKTLEHGGSLLGRRFGVEWLERSGEGSGCGIKSATSGSLGGGYGFLSLGRMQIF